VKPADPQSACLPPTAGLLLAFLKTCPRLWTELAAAGFDRQSSLEAVGELAGLGYCLLITVEGVRLIGSRGRAEA
jgi:hypothetical protein